MRPTISWTWLVKRWSAPRTSLPLTQTTFDHNASRRHKLKRKKMYSTKLRNLHSCTSVRVGTAICTSITFSRHSGFFSRNISNASSFWGIPFIISSRSTPNITWYRKMQGSWGMIETRELIDHRRKANTSVHYASVQRWETSTTFCIQALPQRDHPNSQKRRLKHIDVLQTD